MWPLRVKMPTQNLLRLLLLLILTVGIMLATVCYRFKSWRLVLKLNFFQTLSTRVGQDFEVEVQQDFETGACSAFCCWCFVEVMKLNLGRYSKARFGHEVKFCSDFEHRVGQDFEVEVQARFWSWILFSILLLMVCRGYEVESWSIFRS